MTLPLSPNAPRRRGEATGRAHFPDRPGPAALGRALTLLTIVLAALLLAVPRPAQADAAADALMRRLDEMWRGTSSVARMSMTVKTRHYERHMTMDAWSEGTKKSLVRILEPKKDAGIATLMVERNIWNYLPKINRVTKIPPSMMMTSWMGSHFTNDDLVKESSYEEDYASSISFEGLRDGTQIYQVTSVARPDAAVVWGRIVTVIDKPRLLPLYAVFYDEDGQKVRTLRYLAPKRYGERLVPSRMELQPEDKPDEITVIEYESLTFDVPLPADLFSLARLKQSR